MLAICFNALPAEEQEEAFDRLAELRLERLAKSRDERDIMVASLARAAEFYGPALTIADYKLARSEFGDRGVELAPVSQIIDFYRSWRAARDALGLYYEKSPRAIEARFKKRRLEKIWRYSEEALCRTLADCVAHHGHVPQVAEFDWWRQRELELARQAGDDAKHLPSPTPYRRRYGTWERALLHFGYTPDQVAERLEREA
jgi:hypothetical protein